MSNIEAIILAAIVILTTAVVALIIWCIDLTLKFKDIIDMIEIICEAHNKLVDDLRDEPDFKKEESKKGILTSLLESINETLFGDNS